MNKIAVVALGGNALTREGQRGTQEEQYENAKAMAHSVRSLIRQGWRIVIERNQFHYHAANVTGGDEVPFLPTRCLQDDSSFTDRIQAKSQRDQGPAVAQPDVYRNPEQITGTNNMSANAALASVHFSVTLGEQMRQPVIVGAVW